MSVRARPVSARVFGLVTVTDMVTGALAGTTVALNDLLTVGGFRLTVSVTMLLFGPGTLGCAAPAEGEV